MTAVRDEEWTDVTPPPGSGLWFRRIGDGPVEVVDTGCGAYCIGPDARWSRGYAAWAREDDR